ncbi:MAG: hypothetical protein PHN69_06555 [Candidatus Pacebacteria bacterium]|nr:hypothetical protein [Candidatus Paceibacterota bacterium]
MKDKVTLNKKQIDLFFKEFKYWQNKLGLGHIEVYEVVEDTTNSFATINYHSHGISTLTLNPIFDTFAIKNIETSLRKTAKHEAMHLLLGEFSLMAGARCVTKDELDDAEEHLVRRLMGLIQ